MSVPDTLKVSISGVRGIVGKALTPRHISDFAAAYGTQMGKGRILVGRDTRSTGKMFEHAVVAGLLSVGCKPMIVGIAPTPTVQMAVKEYNANGGIVISASHNPEEWNALKFIGPEGLFLSEAEAEELLHVYNQPERVYVKESEYRSPIYIDGIFDYHKKKILDAIDVKKISSKRYRVAVDCCNGVGALYSRTLLEAMGCEVDTFFDESEGRFYREPEPIAKNLNFICNKMQENIYDIGFAQDPDGDRIVVINPEGEPIGEQYSLLLAAEHLLANAKGSSIAVNIQTSRTIEDIANKYDATVIYTPVGEINVTKALLGNHCLMGGEGGSGGIIWPEIHPCRDSFGGMALILELMACRSKTLNEILDEMPQYDHVNRKYAVSRADAIELIRTLSFEFEKERTDQSDGLKISWEDGWTLIRSSNTEPVLRVFIEGKDPLSINRIEKLLDLENRVHLIGI